MSETISQSGILCIKQTESNLGRELALTLRDLFKRSPIICRSQMSTLKREDGYFTYYLFFSPKHELNLKDLIPVKAYDCATTWTCYDAFTKALKGYIEKHNATTTFSALDGATFLRDFIGDSNIHFILKNDLGDLIKVVGRTFYLSDKPMPNFGVVNNSLLSVSDCDEEDSEPADEDYEDDLGDGMSVNTSSNRGGLHLLNFSPREFFNAVDLGRLWLVSEGGKSCRDYLDSLQSELDSNSDKSKSYYMNLVRLSRFKAVYDCLSIDGLSCKNTSWLFEVLITYLTWKGNIA